MELADSDASGHLRHVPGLRQGTPAWPVRELDPDDSPEFVDQHVGTVQEMSAAASSKVVVQRRQRSEDTLAIGVVLTVVGIVSGRSGRWNVHGGAPWGSAARLASSMKLAERERITAVLVAQVKG